jgi:hypothetical protein
VTEERRNRVFSAERIIAIIEADRAIRPECGRRRKPCSTFIPTQLVN